MIEPTVAPQTEITWNRSPMHAESTDWLPVSSRYHAASTPEVADIVKEAYAQRTAVYPSGGGRHMDVGVRPQREGVGLDFDGWAELLSYPAGDLTVTVSAGMPLSRLDAILAEHRQWLPTAADYPAGTTVGGWLSTAIPTPRRARWGAIADSVAAVRLVDGMGRILRFGVPVVKNAAGYNLARLPVGTLGTLGILTEVSLIVRPRPEVQRVYTTSLADGTAIQRIFHALRGACVLPSAVIWTAGPYWSFIGSTSNSPEGSGTMFVVFEGRETEIEAADMWMAKFTADWSLDWRPQNEDDLPRLCGTMHDAGDGTIVRFSVAPDRVAHFLETWRRLRPGDSFQVDVSSGTIRIVCHGSFRPGDLDFIAEPDWMTAFGNTWVIERHDGGDDWNRRTVWGPRRAAESLARRIKDRLDPKHILNPGRYVFSEDAAE